MVSIPASAIVDVRPSVLGAGGSALDLIGLILTNGTRVPIGSVMRFNNFTDVSSYFGPFSQEAGLANTYFAGYTGSTIAPASLLFSQYPAAPVNAYLRGGTLAGTTLAQLQAITAGVLSLMVDGRSVTSAPINLSTATSFSAAAAIIQTALNDSDAQFTASTSNNTLVVTAVASGTIRVGQVISGSGFTPGTRITALGTGTGGTGTYTVSVNLSVPSTSVIAGQTLVTYDTVSNAFVITAGSPGNIGTITFATGTASAPLALTQATGAVTSQGADAAVPTTAMDAIVAQTQDFVSFMTTFEPSLVDALSFAAWTNSKNNRFVYVSWDTDIVATTNTDTTSLGYVIGQLGYSGTVLIYDPVNGPAISAFLMGSIAAINFANVNARLTLAFRNGGGLTAGVVNQTTANNLAANGYNFYGSYATANSQFTFFYPGKVSGRFLWLDSYVNQVWMNNAFQLLLMNALTTVGSIPFNANGDTLIEAVMMDAINAAVSFGAIRAGVTLSALQVQEMNAAAGGRNIADTLVQRGWYVLPLVASPQVRAARGPKQVTFFYSDGGSVQQIVVSSILTQ